MNESRRARRTPVRIVDIRTDTAAPLPWWRSLAARLRGGAVINLKPTPVERYRIVVVGLFVVIGASVFLGNRFFAHGQVAYFYPSTCLGSWQHTEQAQGKPNAEVPDQVDATNSAVYEGGVQDVFCGSFAGNVPEGSIKRVTIRPSWYLSTTKRDTPVVVSVPNEREAEQQQVDDGVAPSPTAQPPVPVETSPGTNDGGGSEEKGSFLDRILDVIPSSDVEFKIETPTTEQPAPPPTPEPPAPTPTESPATPNEAPASLLVQRVHAQETTEPAPEASPAPTPATTELTLEAIDQPTPPPTPPVDIVLPNNESPAPQQEPPLTTNGGGTATTTNEQGSSTEAVLTETSSTTPTTTEDYAFVVSYTLDGQSWNELQRVNARNWQQAEIEVPVGEWQDLSKLQIKISPHVTVDTQPFLYLDGWTLAAEYDGGEDTTRLPDFANDTPLVVATNEQYAMIKVLQHADGREVLWAVDRGEHPQWQVLAEEEQCSRQIAPVLKGSYVFWMSPDLRSINSINLATQSSFSQSVDPNDSASARLTFDDGKQTAVLLSDRIAFTSTATGAISPDTLQPGDNDAVVSETFWMDAARALVLAATSTTSTADVATTSTVTSTLIEPGDIQLLPVTPPTTEGGESVQQAAP